MTRARLAAGDKPIDPVEVQAFEWPEQRLGTDEPDGRRDQPKSVSAAHEATILDRCADPDIRRPIETRSQLRQALMSLGQHLERVPVRTAHRLEYLLDEWSRDV